ncbi:MAG: PAS domain S-box protein [Acidobacteria bacterium]|nr:PAS domain S-box protein [Acidobacteriota bacterium]
MTYEMALFLVFGIGLADSLTGPELSLTVFYLIPIVFSVHKTGLAGGVFASIASVGAYLAADHIFSTRYSHAAIPVWNSGVRLSFFLAVTYFLSRSKLAEEKLAQSEERFRLLVEGVNDYSILMLDSDGRVSSWNAGARRIFGYEADEALGCDFSLFYPPEDVREGRSARMLRTAREQGKMAEEGWCTRKDASRFWADVAVTALGDPAEKPRGYSMLARDITERRGREEAIRMYVELHQIDRAILAAGSSGNLAVEALTRLKALIPYEEASVTLYEMTMDHCTLLAHCDRDGITAEAGELPIIDMPGEQALSALEKGQTVFASNPDALRELQAITSAFSSDVGAVACLPLLSQGKLVGSLNLAIESTDVLSESGLESAREVASQLAVATHNTQLFEQVQEAHQRLQTLSRRLLEVQENERRHLARELHDEVGQALTAVKIHLQEMDGAVGDSRSRVCESITIVDGLLRKIRDLSLDLRPLVLDDLGLVAALRSCASRQSRLSGFEVSFTATPDELRLSPDLETACFRIAQETLTNAARHAHARRVRLEIRREGCDLHLSIKDDGIGFDVSSALGRASRGESLGLLGMRERASLLGGEIEVESAPAHGTEVRVRLPIPASG